MFTPVLAPFLSLGLALQIASNSTGGGSRGAAPPTPPGGSNVQISSPSGAAQWSPTIAADPSDRLHLVAAAFDARNFASQSAFYASFDGGGTWSEWFDQGPSGLATAAFGSAGELYLCSDHLDASGTPVLAVGRSYDGGLTVASWATLFTFGNMTGIGLPELAVDRSQGAYAGSVYLACGFYAPGSQAIYFMASHDGGQTWAGRPINDDSLRNVAGASIAVDSSGVIHVSWYDLTKGLVYADSSADGGNTWGRDVIVAKASYFVLPSDPNQNRIFPCPRMATDRSGGPYDGNLYLTWAKDGGTGGPDVVLTSSADGGATWSKPIRASDVATNCQFTPSIDVDSNGDVAVGFYDCRDDPANTRVHYYVSRSSDGGLTFQPNVRVSDSDFLPTYHKNGYEDRVGIAASGTTVHAIWTDARNGDQDVFGGSAALGFHTDVAELSAATGGTVAFSVSAGPLHQNDAYRILGSASGTAPGLDLGLVHLPLEFDAFMVWTVFAANTSTLPGFAGTLDASGAASASLVSGPLPPALIGFQMDFAALVRTGAGWAWSSDPTHLAIGN